jgi:hypothetical protein
VAGWCYQLIVGLELAANSGTAPVDLRRLAPDDNINLVAAGQIRGLLERLRGAATATVQGTSSCRWWSWTAALTRCSCRSSLPAPPFSCGCASAVTATSPPPADPRHDGRPGRPARHGARLSLADPASWPAPTASWQEADAQYGQVTVTAWGGLDPKQRTYRDADGHLRIVAGTLVRVQVARLPGRARAPKTLWLWWAGPAGIAPELALVWRA